MQHYLLYVFRAISKIVRMMMIPMTMRAIMAPEPETDGEGREAFILIACSSVTASYLHVRFHRFPCCTVYLICPVGVCSSLAKKSLAYKQSVTATALESKLIALNRVDIYKPWLKSFYFIDTRSNTDQICNHTHSGWVFVLWTSWRSWCSRWLWSCSQVRRSRLASSAITCAQKQEKQKTQCKWQILQMIRAWQENNK